MNDDGEVNRPDIIIHTRGNNDNNLAIIEIKWTKNRGDDAEKVRKFRRLNYEYGVVVRFDGIGDLAELKIYDYANDGLYDQLEQGLSEHAE